MFVVADGQYASAQTIPSSLITSNERQITKKEMESKIVVLNFWFMTCGPCLREMSDLKSLQERYGKNNHIIFIAISSMDDSEQLEMFRKYKDFGYELIPKNSNWINYYKIKLYPTNMILDKGQVVFKQEGYNEKKKLVDLEKKITTLVLKQDVN
ncbi:redoxin domain-containing protein [Olivibacter ginsenosidimutans]|uniref:Redoxin domain-containing protein n=1 Tax=Olivibacter ginsenosidimutans TaxID=1176537 RepID=A0ABP9AEM6_9SPHI